MLWPLAASQASQSPPDGASLAPDRLGRTLRGVAGQISAHYECKVAIAVQTANASLAVAAGGAVDDRFVWGSVTKQLTGATLLQLAAAHGLSLDQPVAPFLDPQLAALGLSPLASLFGAEAASITARHLATMRSGIPDYDTATPSVSKSDPFRAKVYSAPGTAYPPAQLLNLSWVSLGHLQFRPGSAFAYSSTNFVLLGLLLAALTRSPRWSAFDQATVLASLPERQRQLYRAMRFALLSTPRAWDAVGGFDRTSYNGAKSTARPGRDVSAVVGVFAGWTASDLVAPAKDVARFGYDLYGKHGAQLLNADSVQLMSHFGVNTYYGFAAFDLGFQISGQSSGGPYFAAYGHLGATYGYQSVLAYFPGIDASLAVATNIETDNQAQPASAACLAYNALLTAHTGHENSRCAYRTREYFGRCDCGANWRCDMQRRMCVWAEEGFPLGTLSQSDCERLCNGDNAAAVLEQGGLSKLDLQAIARRPTGMHTSRAT